MRDVSFSVSKGELFGLIGPDGAGKTTLFRILATLMLADKGEARVDGLDVVRDFKALRKRVGYMPGRFSLYTDLTVEENLSFFASIFNTTVEENYSLVEDIYRHIEPFRKFRAGKLSGGMKQKLALSCALIHRPSVLFLDEPTTGVDAVSRKEFWELLHRLRGEGITILVSTPYMDEAGRCDRVALIQQGHILQVNTPAGLKSAFGRRLIAVKGGDTLSLQAQFAGLPEVEDVYPFGDSVHVVLRPGADALQMPEGVEMREAEPEVEDCFISLMKGHG